MNPLVYCCHLCLWLSQFQVYLVLMAKKISTTRINIQLFDIFKKVHGDLHVPRRFVIPREEVWPQESHGMKFGNYVDRIRATAMDKNGIYNKQDIRLLVEKGLVLNKQEFDSQEVLKCFQIFKKKYNTTIISSDFRVPEEAPWPKTQWGTSLSGVIRIMKQKRSEHKTVRDEIAALGYDISVQTPELPSFEKLYAALSAYKACHANLLMPVKFVIPHNDSRYPEESWGLPLGKLVEDIRDDKIFKESKQALQDLGLIYEKKKRPAFKDIATALRTYRDIHGHCNVPTSFAIAEGDLAYPVQVQGMQLGNLMHSIRTQGLYKEHKQVLVDIGVDMELGPRYPFEVKLLALQTYQRLNDHLNVPQHYRIPDDDEQYPEETRGLNLGNEVRKIRHKGYHAEKRPQLEAIGFVYKEAKPAKEGL